MSQLLVDDIVNKDDSGAVSASKGINVSGIATLGIASASQFEVAGVTTHYQDVEFPGANYNVAWDQATSKIKWDDSAQATFGTGNDLQIYHDGSDSFLKSNTGELRLVGVTTVGILTAYESITVKVGGGSTELASAINTNTTNIATKASTGKAIAMAMVFG